MSLLNSTFGSAGAVGGGVELGGAGQLGGADRLGDKTSAVERFQNALDRASQPAGVSNVKAASGHFRIAQNVVQGATPANGVQPSANSPQDVLKSLQLDASNTPQGVGSTGDLILGGLKKLRGMFDTQHTNLNVMMNKTGADTTSLMAMQVEVVKYSLLIDVASKLTGKSTQSFDTLMKGQ